MKSRIGILVLGILLMLSTSFAMSVTKHDGYNVNIVNEDGVEITSANAEWDEYGRILTISGTFYIQESLGSVQIGYSANGSPNLTTSIAFGKGNKTLNLWTSLGGVDKIYSIQSTHAGKNLKDTHHVNFIADSGNITEDFKVEISCPYEKLDEAYVWVGDTSAIIKVTAVTGNVKFTTDNYEITYVDETGGYSSYKLTGGTELVAGTQHGPVVQQDSVVGYIFSRRDGTGVSDRMTGTMWNNVAHFQTSKSGYVYDNYFFREGNCFLINITSYGANPANFKGQYISTPMDYGYLDTQRDPGAGDWNFDDSSTTVNTPAEEKMMALYDSEATAIYDYVSGNTDAYIRIQDGNEPILSLLHQAVDIGNVWIRCLDDATPSQARFETFYDQLIRLHGLIITMVTGTNTTAKSSLLLDVVPDVNEDLEFMVTCGITDSDVFNNTCYVQTSPDHNFTTTDLYIYMSDTAIDGAEDLAVHLNWEIDHFNVNETAGKFSCSAGDAYGRDCNGTMDINGNPTDGYNMWFSAYNHTYYIIQDTAYTAYTNFTTSPVVLNMTLNSTSPYFYDSVRCNATVNDSDGFNEIINVWSNITYDNGTIIGKSMSNITSFDWYADYSNLDYTGNFTCNATVYDNGGSTGANQTSGLMKSPIDLILTYNSAAYEMSNQTYRATYTANNFISGFNVSFIYDGMDKWLNYNSSTQFTKYYTPYFESVNNTFHIPTWNTTVSYLNGTSFYNQTNGTQYVIFGYAISGNASSNDLLEGQNFTYTLNETASITYSNITRYLFFNGTNYTITETIGGMKYINITMPRMNETEKTNATNYFGWTQINNGTYYRNQTSTSNTVNIYKTLLTNCYPDSNATIEFMQFYIYDERNRTVPLNSSIDVLWYIHNDAGGISRSQNFMKYDITGGAICGYPAWAKFNYVNMTFSFWAEDVNFTAVPANSTLHDFPTRYYYFTRELFANTTTLNKSINVYLIEDTFSQQYELTVLDKNRQAIEGAIVQVLRRYSEDVGGGGTFFAAMTKVASSGRAYVYLEKPLSSTLPNITSYKFQIYLDGRLIHEDREYRELSSATAIPTFEIDLEQTLTSYKKSAGLYANCTETLAVDTGTVSCALVDDTLSVLKATRTINKMDLLNGNTQVCSTELLTSTAGYNFEWADCNLGNVTGSYYTWSMTVVYKDGNIITRGGRYDHSTSFNWGDTGIFIALFLTIALIMFGLFHPVFALIMCALAIIINAMFGFIAWGLGTVVWVMITIGIVIFTVMRG